MNSNFSNAPFNHRSQRSFEEAAIMAGRRRSAVELIDDVEISRNDCRPEIRENSRAKTRPDPGTRDEYGFLYPKKTKVLDPVDSEQFVPSSTLEVLTLDTKRHGPVEAFPRDMQTSDLMLRKIISRARDGRRRRRFRFRNQNLDLAPSTS